MVEPYLALSIQVFEPISTKLPSQHFYRYMAPGPIETFLPILAVGSITALSWIPFCSGYGMEKSSNILALAKSALLTTIKGLSFICAN